MTEKSKARPLFDPPIVKRAVVDAFRKLDPRDQVRNPVMFVVLVGSVLTTGLFIQACSARAKRRPGSFWRSRCGCGSRCCSPTSPKRWPKAGARPRPTRCARRGATSTPRNWRSRAMGQKIEQVVGQHAAQGRCGAGGSRRFIPSDGEAIEGVASVDESAITGESAPVIRESGGDRSAVTGGTRVLSDWLVVRITANPGETFLDRMIGMVEGAKRQKTPNEIALNILLAAMTIIFLLVASRCCRFRSTA